MVLLSAKYQYRQIWTLSHCTITNNLLYAAFQADGAVAVNARRKKTNMHL